MNISWLDRVSNKDVVITPNPTTGRITISIPPQTGKCVVTDVTGRVMLTKDFTGSVIDMDINAADGLYIAQITNATTGASVLRKFVVQH